MHQNYSKIDASRQHIHVYSDAFFGTNVGYSSELGFFALLPNTSDNFHVLSYCFE